jgi:hypothetical protein
MLDKIFRNIQEKSLKERFLLFIGVLFFVLYFILGLLIIFMDNFPLDMKIGYRIALEYSGFICLYKVFRIINDNSRLDYEKFRQTVFSSPDICKLYYCKQS